MWNPAKVEPSPFGLMVGVNADSVGKSTDILHKSN